jgi:penicillin-binding protein 2
MTEGRTGIRLKVLAFLVLSMFAALSTRLWFLQVLAAEQNRDIAGNQSIRLVETRAQRGIIYDVDGEKLVESRLSLVITINRQEAGADEEDVLYRLSQLLDVPAAELGEPLDSGLYYPYSPVPVAVDVPEKVVSYIEEHDTDFPGVEIEHRAVRAYPLQGLAAHVLGYLGQISQEKLDSPEFAEYAAGDLVGVAGVESVYEQDLAGTDGVVKYEVNAAGDSHRLGDDPAIPGDDVYLTLDADLQQLAEESLRLGIQHARGIIDQGPPVRYLAANAGAVIVMNPDDGAIEAMASNPSFLPSAFTQPMTSDEIERRFGAAQGFRLINRAIAGQYPPGSTYKPWVALSAMSQRREGSNETILSTDRGYSCPPSYTVPFDEDNPDAIQYVFNNWTTANLGTMNVSRALAESCDTVFYPAGYEYWRLFWPTWGPDGQAGTPDDVFREPLQHDLGAIGFGRETNVDLPFEVEGRVPTAEWKRRIHEDYPRAFPFGDWVPGDFINMSIGQGDTLVTPLQLASAYAALQNDGRQCTPHMLDRVVDSVTDEVVRSYRPTCRPLRAFDPADLSYVRDALTDTVRSGTAQGAFAGFPFGEIWLAGKTGTAEVDPKQDYSWFAAMSEANGERHVVVVLVEQGGHGSTTAAPIARRIVEGLYGMEFSGVGLGGETALAGTD